MNNSNNIRCLYVIRHTSAGVPRLYLATRMIMDIAQGKASW